MAEDELMIPLDEEDLVEDERPAEAEPPAEAKRPAAAPQKKPTDESNSESVAAEAADKLLQGYLRGRQF
jgi:hypothetical protein